MRLRQLFLLFFVPAFIGFAAVYLKPVTAWVTWWRLEREGTLADQQGHTLEAIMLYQQGCKQYPEDGTFKFRLARLYQKQQRGAEALNLYRQGERLLKSPPKLEDRLNYARLLSNEKLWNDAVKQYRLALDENGAERNLLYELGSFYSTAAQDAKTKGYPETQGWFLKKASYYLEKTLNVDPHYGPAHFSLGLVYQQRKSWLKASQHFCEAYPLTPVPDIARYQLGFSLAQLGYRALGAQLMSKALQDLDKAALEDETADTSVASLKEHFHRWHLGLAREGVSFDKTPELTPKELKEVERMKNLPGLNSACLGLTLPETK